MDVKNDVLNAHREASEVISALAAFRSRNNKAVGRSADSHRVLLNRGAPVTNPSGFWAEAMESSESKPAEVELAIKLSAAQLKLGDVTFVMESGIGQVGWLSATAIELKREADDQPVNSNARTQLLALSLRYQTAAAKLMLSLAALVQIGSGGGRGEREVKGS